MIQTIKNWFLPVKYAYQRVVRGWDDRLLWDLPGYIEPMIVAQVKNLRENCVGHPHNITEKKWKKVLDTILKGFVPEPDMGANMKEWKKYMNNKQKALILLAAYWDNLWD